MECNNVLKYSLFFLIITILAIILNKKKNDKKEIKILMILFSIVLLYFVDKYCTNLSTMLENFSDEDTAQLPGYAPISYSMGTYDNLRLKPPGCSDWRHPPACKKLYNPNTLYTPQGTPFPLKPKISKQGNNNGPTVDGTNKTPNDMFIFAYNQCRPECCPSTYSCDHGCVCTNKQQREFLNSRGNNRNINYLYGQPRIDA